MKVDAYPRVNSHDASINPALKKGIYKTQTRSHLKYLYNIEIKCEFMSAIQQQVKARKYLV